MHRGSHYLVDKFDLTNLKALVVPRPHCTYYTDSRDHTDVTVVSRERTHRDNVHAHNGVVNVNRFVNFCLLPELASVLADDGIHLTVVVGTCGAIAKFVCGHDRR